MSVPWSSACFFALLASLAGCANGARGAAADVDLSRIEPDDLRRQPDPDERSAAEARAEGLVAELTPEEKLALVHGVPGTYVGNVPAVPRLGIAALALQDGPAGVTQLTDVTAFPAPITVAASFDRTLVQRWAAAMAREERGKGVLVQLGPMMNLVRVPRAGRNFESFGEDPYLCAELSAAAVRGIQGEHVVATAKHFVGNEQETARTSESSEIDARTRWEVYYAPFEAAVAAGVGAVMCAYNRLDGIYACEHPEALSDLKQGMGFGGWVMSDWGATHSAIAAANAGLDMEMPGGEWFGAPLAAALEDGSVPTARLDDMVRRQLTSLAAVGLLDDPPEPTPAAVVGTEEHRALAREAAIAGVTLLRNERAALPLDDAASLAVIGVAAASGAVAVGGGSATVNAPYVVTPLDAVTRRAGPDVTVTYVAGPGEDAVATLDDAVAAASGASAALVFVAVPSSEGVDRDSLALPRETDDLIAAVAAANPRTSVVLHAPGAVLMPWVDRVAAVLFGGYPGQENGDAIAAILFGDAAPSGRLPVSFPRVEADLPAPGLAESVHYGEGLALGYRKLDADGVEPLFPFGHGLSYTRFEYGALELDTSAAPERLELSFALTNVGEREGTEVPQLYVGFPASAREPPRVLRGFDRVTLAAGETRRVTLTLTPRDLRVWSLAAGGFAVPGGTYHLYIGSSSRDLRLERRVTVAGTVRSP